MGFDKLLAKLAEGTVLQRSFDALANHPSIHSLVVVCPTDRWKILTLPESGKPIVHTTGGPLRQDSALMGTRGCPDETTHIAIHDAARPLVSEEDLTNVLQASQRSGAASLAHRIVDTLKRSDSAGFIREPVSRDDLWGMETPQVFSRNLLMESFSIPGTGEFTDEVSRLQATGHPVAIVESRNPNPKITTPADLRLAKALLQADS